ncbi:DsbA family protein [Lachnospiraceae bacterium OttesenSCG-928-E19]|nr:DsbA family protein [Lachnospiraceae bacterium OttesenSCG-928-E19]
MTWTILILVLAIALFIFGSMIIKNNGKNASAKTHIAQNSIKVIAVIIIAGCVCRLWTPYYLTSVNPAIVQEMVTGMQEQQQADASKGIKKYVRSNMDKMIADAPILGNAEAKKTIFLFSAYSCGYCGRVHSELLRVLEDRDDVRVVLKNFSIHGPLSDAPARAVIAAKLQSNELAGKLDKRLFEGYYEQDDIKDQSKAGEVIKKNVLKIAKEVGLDVTKLEADMNGPAVAREMAQVRDLADRFQIGGTPFLIIGDQAYPGAIPYDQIINALK